MANKNSSNSKNLTRRDFVKNLAVGSGALVLLGNYKILFSSTNDEGIIKAIVVDFNKCTGCRICETVCSAFNFRQTINGESLQGLGNPFLSNIRVQHYNPDVDIPSVCAMCPDYPCIEACPVPADPKTGRKALYRDEKTLAIKNDIDRCIGCGKCAEACKTKSVGVIILNPETNKPEHICNLCDGDPQCVKYCPFDALSYLEVDTKREFYRMSPDTIAEELKERFYNIKEWK
jgi:carbon-monoxide dehydrogenase iron sulfur subunit